LYPSVRFAVEIALVGALSSTRQSSSMERDLAVWVLGEEAQLGQVGDMPERGCLRKSVAVNALVDASGLNPDGAAAQARELCSLGYRAVKVKVCFCSLRGHEAPFVCYYLHFRASWKALP
jgi:hypothetical protein